MGTTKATSLSLHSNLTNLNWDFTGESGAAGLANFHWYPGRFVPQLAGLLIDNLTKPGDLVLDPFCGSGTTLVEAHRLGRGVVGIDVNPIATLIARAKLQPWQSRTFQNEARAVHAAIERNFSHGLLDDSISLGAERSEGWYHSNTSDELSAIWAAVRETDYAYAYVFQAAFSSILRACCSQNKHWGWVCDNVKPKEMIYRPAIKFFNQKLRDYALTASDFERDRLAYAEIHPGTRTDTGIHLGQAQTILRLFADQSVDALVTSPPYYSVTDYTRSQRLSFLWLGLELDEVKPQETGARFKRFRKTARQQYLHEMQAIFVEVARVLRPGALCGVVAGESPAREPYVAELMAISEGVGLQQEIAIGRRISSRRTIASDVDSESILILRKSG